MYAPVLVESPVDTPVTLEEAKAALDISYSEKNEMIDGLIAGVTAWLDGWNGVLGGRCLCEQIWRQDFDSFDTCLRLPLLPVISAIITYRDSDGAEQTIADEDFSIREDEKGAYIKFATGFSQPTLSSEEFPPLSVEFVAGYEDVPANIKNGMLLIIRMLFDNPAGAVIGATVESLPFGPRALLFSSVRMNV